MKKTLGSDIFKDIPIMSMIVVLILLIYFQLQCHSIFSDDWFPSQFAISTFMILFCVWILSEIMNSLFSRKNSHTTNMDKGSSWVIIAVCLVSTLYCFYVTWFWDRNIRRKFAIYRTYFACGRYCTSRMVDLGSWKVFYRAGTGSQKSKARNNWTIQLYQTPILYWRYAIPDRDYSSDWDLGWSACCICLKLNRISVPHTC